MTNAEQHLADLAKIDAYLRAIERASADRTCDRQALRQVLQKLEVVLELAVIDRQLCALLAIGGDRRRH
ncbi:MAG TPA: hypothetical protein VH519_05560 [Hyphomicrobiaceae bacterium]|jgi:hypothetical protein